MKKLLTLLIGFLFVAVLNAQYTNTYTYPFYIGKAGTSTGKVLYNYIIDLTDL